jgi:ATP-dependent DNA helicase DinG
VIRVEVARAGGREVCFLAEVTEDGTVVDPRAVARGNHVAVLAAAKDAPQGALMIHNHPSGVLEPSAADLAVAARIFDEGLGSALVNNEATEMYVVVEPPQPRRVERLDPEELASLLAPGGTLSSVFSGFEDRPGQRQMLSAVTAAFNDGGVSLVEAGTGTGKSLAYLLPAAAWAVRNGERAVVSTGTINLQEQLVGKDLPIVSSLMEEPISWALVKGRSNYVSIRRALLATDAQESLFDEDRGEELRGLIEWLDTTEDGSLSDLATVPSEDVWDEVRSDADICLRARCPHFQRCFYQRSRREAASANVLVVNHHLLFSDLSVRISTNNFKTGAVLPPYARLILDEAHNVEEAATSHLGVEVTRVGLFRTLSRLDRRGKGILTAVHGALLGRGDEGEAPRLLRRIEERIRPALEDVRARTSLLVEDLEPLAEPGTGPVRLGTERGPEPVTRLATRDRLDGLMAAMGKLEREVRHLREGIETQPELIDLLEDRTLDLQSVERRLAAGAHGVRLVLAPGPGEDGYVRWIEQRGKGRRTNLVLGAAPLEPGALLREALFEPLETVVLTSATLTTRGTFSFLRSRLGIGEGAGEPEAWEEEESEPLEIAELAIPSPFDYERQVIMAVPAGLGDAGGGNERFQRETASFVSSLAGITDGGIFVLFTSFRALRSVAAMLREAGVDGRWPLFVHGEGPRARLLDGFVDSGRGILLGTTSFWEGVDVPGEPLRGLVIQKLPFPVPTEPLTEARVEALEARGRNSFWEYVLPIAALRLKQGFGRLIRGRTDRGVVAVLDSRIIVRRYGRYLRDSLPPAPVLKGRPEEIWDRIEAFFGET